MDEIVINITQNLRCTLRTKKIFNPMVEFSKY